MMTQCGPIDGAGGKTVAAIVDPTCQLLLVEALDPVPCGHDCK